MVSYHSIENAFDFMNFITFFENALLKRKSLKRLYHITTLNEL
jgi:hypothetical protein